MLTTLEQLLYHPKGFLQRLTLCLLAPLGWLTCLIGWFQLMRSKPSITPPLPTISVGNLTAGGTGKTPLIAALAKHHKNVAIILRGYGRKSRGLVVVAHKGSSQADLQASGDEAALYHQLLPQASVIVCSNRLEAIYRAHELGAEVVFLDDAFRHRHIKKYDLLIRPTPEPENHRCLPAGPYRLPQKAHTLADRVVQEGIDFWRHTHIVNPTERMALLTAIARPHRLEPHLPPLIGRRYYPDHHPFTQEEARTTLEQFRATSLLVTQKDAVKLEAFGLPLSILKLEIRPSKSLLQSIANYTRQ